MKYGKVSNEPTISVSLSQVLSEPEDRPNIILSYHTLISTRDKGIDGEICEYLTSTSKSILSGCHWGWSINVHPLVPKATSLLYSELFFGNRSQSAFWEEDKIRPAVQAFSPLVSSICVCKRCFERSLCEQTNCTWFSWEWSPCALQKSRRERDTHFSMASWTRGGKLFAE